MTWIIINLMFNRTFHWEKKLKKIFNRIDDYLEEKYGNQFPLHPARSAKGMTCSKQQDGLFNVGASFSPGYGSDYGSGYVIEVRMVTLEKVPDLLRSQIEKEVVKLLKKELPKEFPGKNLNVDRDDRVYKIYGDLSLGRL